MSASRTSRPGGKLPETGDLLDGRYRLGEAIAAGGMGVIRQAEQLHTGRQVAVKLLHPDVVTDESFAARFRREARVATLFDHSSIVRVYDVGETDTGALYLVMELLDGEELKSIIAREAPLPAGRAINIALQMLDGLAEAHTQGVVHRDIKPSNIFVCKRRRDEEEVKILDFGLAKVINSTASEVTSAGEVTGTPSYLAPESIFPHVAKSELRMAGDIYAAGLVILEMFTGVKCFDGKGLPDTLVLHLQQPVKIPEELATTPLGEVLRRATAKHPAHRFANAEKMYLELKKARTSVPYRLRVEKKNFLVPSPTATSAEMQRLFETANSKNLDILAKIPQHTIISPDGTQKPWPARLGQKSDGSAKVAQEFDAGPTQLIGHKTAKMAPPPSASSTPSPGPIPTPGQEPPDRTPPSTSAGPAGLEGDEQATQKLGPAAIAQVTPLPSTPQIASHHPDPTEAIAGRSGRQSSSGGDTRRNYLAIGGGAFLVVVLVGVVVIAFTAEDDPEAEIAEASAMAEANEELHPIGSAKDRGPPELEPEQREEIFEFPPAIRITSTPAGATVLLDGEALGVTELDLDAAMVQEASTVLLQKEGYQDALMDFPYDSDEIAVVLEPKSPEKPVASQARNDRRGSSGETAREEPSAPAPATSQEPSPIERQERPEPASAASAGDQPDPPLQPAQEASQDDDDDEPASGTDLDGLIDEHLFSN